MNILTIGHSTRSTEEFTSLLLENNVKHLLDVRSIPFSRFCPQFGQGELPEALQRVGIKYTHIPQVGGLRKKSKTPSVNMAWRNASFRNYADYMQTIEFEAGLEMLMNVAQNELCATMCSEAVPWKCHRSLISDALIVRGWNVEDIMSKGKKSVHKITKFASVDGNAITYSVENTVEEKQVCLI